MSQAIPYLLLAGAGQLQRQKQLEEEQQRKQLLLDALRQVKIKEAQEGVPATPDTINTSFIDTTLQNLGIPVPLPTMPSLINMAIRPTEPLPPIPYMEYKKGTPEIPPKPAEYRLPTPYEVMTRVLEHPLAKNVPTKDMFELLKVVYDILPEEQEEKPQVLYPGAALYKGGVKIAEQPPLPKETEKPQRIYSYHDGGILNELTGEFKPVIDVKEDKQYYFTTDNTGTVYAINKKNPNEVIATEVKTKTPQEVKGYETQEQAEQVANLYRKQGGLAVVYQRPDGRWDVDKYLPHTSQKSGSKTTSKKELPQGLKSMMAQAIKDITLGRTTREGAYNLLVSAYPEYSLEIKRAIFPPTTSTGSTTTFNDVLDIKRTYEKYKKQGGEAAVYQPQKATPQANPKQTQTKPKTATEFLKLKGLLRLLK